MGECTGKKSVPPSPRRRLLLLLLLTFLFAVVRQLAAPTRAIASKPQQLLAAQLNTLLRNAQLLLQPNHHCSAVLAAAVAAATTATAQLPESAEWRSLPPHVHRRFTMHGRVPRGDEMLRDAHTGAAKRRWSGRTVQAWSSAARRARDALSAGDVSVRTAARDAAAAGLTHPYASSSALEDIFAALHAHPIEGLEGLVVGSETPWIEAILLGFGAARVTTAEYRAIALEQDDDPRRAAHPLRLDVMRPAALWRRLAREGGQHARFDFVFAFSSIEHDGLARFGDAVAPDADLETMARLRCALRPNGRAFIAVPTGPDFLQWYVQFEYVHT
tara:strand:+ start:2482 stop:3471 length:990 start_codon:yes stop_codon:yes gene_type:complete